MEGRLSMEKAKKVREKRELQKELGEWVFGVSRSQAFWIVQCHTSTTEDDRETRREMILILMNDSPHTTQRTYRHSKKPSYTAPPHAPKDPRMTKERRPRVGMRVMWRMRTKSLVRR